MGGNELNYKVKPTSKDVNNVDSSNGRNALDCTNKSIDELSKSLDDTNTKSKKRLRNLDRNVISFSKADTEIVEINQNTECCIDIKIGDRKYKTLWDTGAGKCVISKEQYLSLPEKEKTPLLHSNVVIRGAEGSLIKNDGECEINFQLGPVKFTFPFLVSSALTQGIILGYNFKRAYKIGSDWTKNDEMYLKMKGQFLTTTISTKDINTLVQCTETTIIPPRSNAKIPCKASKLAIQENMGKVCRFEPSKRLSSENSFWFAHDGIVVIDKEVKSSGIFHIVMSNKSHQTIKVSRNYSLGLLKSCDQKNIETIHKIASFETPMGEPKPKQVERQMYAIPIRNKQGEIEINTLIPELGQVRTNIHEIGPQEDFVKYQKPKLEDAPVSAKILEDLDKLFEENKNAFATDETEIGTTPLIKMTIDTGDHPPIAKRPYTLALKHDEWARKEIDKLLEAGVIRESHSSWSAPVVIVPKSNGEKRLCVDFRSLNKITRTYIWPMPRAEDIFAKLGKAKYFTTLDLRAGYHHIALDKNSIKKTGFCLPFGKYEYLKVPFGLAQAPAYFQNLMNKVLKGLSFAISYLDDIIIFSETPEEHLKHIKIVLKRLQDANLKMKKSKCSFFKKELHYLGHLLTTKGIKPQPEKVEAITNLKPPTSVKGVREFLGMVGYYRKFIPRFGDAALPLTQLTRKGIKFVWSDKCQIGFDYLRKALTKDPILKYPDPSKRYVLFTDASDIAAAGVLCQEYPDCDGKITELPIAYLSTQFTEDQYKWSTIVKEGYAIYYCVKKWKPYLDDAEILLKSDAKSLEKFLEGRTNNNKLDRWSLELQGKRITCVHIPGTQNKAADCLSRLPYATRKRNDDPLNDENSLSVNCIQNTEEPTTECRLCEVNTETDLTDTLALQKKDTFCIRISKELEDPESKLPNKDRYSYDKELLYHTNLDNGKEYKALVVPKILIPTILKEMHDRLGHFGISKTYSLIKRYYFWPKMIKHIQRHVEKCSLCRRENMTADKYQLETTEIPNQAFSKIGMDLIVELDVSHQGNKNILVIVDHLTSYPLAIPIPNKEAPTIADAFYNHFILQHGCPNEIVSDNGKEFDNDTLAYVCEEFNIQPHFTSPYYPQANGKTENFNKFLKASIRKLCQDDKQGWDQVLNQIVWAYRCCPHTSSGESPYFMVYHRDPVLPIHKLIKPTVPYRGNFDIAYQMQQGQIALTTAAKNLKKKREAQKRPFLKNPSEHKFKVGDLVLYKKHDKKKLELKWEPGYRIVELPTKWSARITNKETGEPRRANIRDLKLKDPAEDWELKAENIGRGAKFINDPKGLPDIDWTPENDNPIRDNPNVTKDSPKRYNLRKSVNPPTKLNL